MFHLTMGRQTTVSTRKTIAASKNINVSLVYDDHIILPPLHINLGLVEQFVNALDKGDPCFIYICSEFPSLNKEKLKTGNFSLDTSKKTE